MSCTDVFNKKRTAFADELVIKEATMRRCSVKKAVIWSNAPGYLDGSLMLDPWDGQWGKMPHYCPGEGGMGAAGID